MCVLDTCSLLEKTKSVDFKIETMVIVLDRTGLSMYFFHASLTQNRNLCLQISTFIHELDLNTRSKHIIIFIL